MRTLFAIGLGLILAACNVLKSPTEVNVKPMDVNDFLIKPFGHNESIDQFKKNLPHGTKMQKLIKRAPQDRHSPDTIYNFTLKKSKVSLYKTRFNQEFVLGGIIKNPQIELTNGIRQGMSREKFFKSFNDLSISTNDTITLKYQKIDRTFNFYFKRNRLDKFTFTGSNPKPN
jgi:hypothetical protein